MPLRCAPTSSICLPFSSTCAFGTAGGQGCYCSVSMLDSRDGSCVGQKTRSAPSMSCRVNVISSAYCVSLNAPNVRRIVPPVKPARDSHLPVGTPCAAHKEGAPVLPDAPSSLQALLHTIAPTCSGRPATSRPFSRKIPARTDIHTPFPRFSLKAVPQSAINIGVPAGFFVFPRGPI